MVTAVIRKVTSKYIFFHVDLVYLYVHSFLFRICKICKFFAFVFVCGLASYFFCFVLILVNVCVINLPRLVSYPPSIICSFLVIQMQIMQCYSKCTVLLFLSSCSTSLYLWVFFIFCLRN